MAVRCADFHTPEHGVATSEAESRGKEDWGAEQTHYKIFSGASVLPEKVDKVPAGVVVKPWTRCSGSQRAPTQAKNRGPVHSRGIACRTPPSASRSLVDPWGHQHT